MKDIYHKLIFNVVEGKQSFNMQNHIKILNYLVF